MVGRSTGVVLSLDVRVKAKAELARRWRNIAARSPGDRRRAACVAAGGPAKCQAAAARPGGKAAAARPKCEASASISVLEERANYLIDNNQIRGLLKNFGLIIGRGKFNFFAVRAAELIEDRRVCAGPKVYDRTWCRPPHSASRPRSTIPRFKRSRSVGAYIGGTTTPCLRGNRLVRPNLEVR